MLWLVDPSGAAVRVQWPMDPCGRIQSRALDRFSMLREVSRTTAELR